MNSVGIKRIAFNTFFSLFNPKISSSLRKELRQALLKRPLLPFQHLEKSGWKYEFESEDSLNRFKMGSTRESLVRESLNTRLGKFVISPSGQYYAFILVPYFKEQGNLIVRSFQKGLVDVVIKNVFNFCWIPSLNQSLEKIIFTRLDDKLHSSRALVFNLESRCESILHSNPSKTDFVDIYCASDQSGAFISCSSKHTSESLYIDLNLKITLLMPRSAGKVYQVDRFNNDWILIDNNKKLCFVNSQLPLEWFSLNQSIEFDKPILDVVPMKTDRLALLTSSKIYIIDCKSKKIKKEINLEVGSYKILPSISQAIPSSLQIRFSSPVIVSGQFILDNSGNISQLQKVTVGNMDKYIIDALVISKTLVTIIYKKNQTSNHKRPCLLYSYGVYKERIELSYRYHHIPLLERGFVIALVHLEEGPITNNKMDTCLELIAIAKSLKSTYSTLIHESFSAGCALSAAAINVNPDLFDCLVWRAPFLNPFDSMMNPDLPLSLSEIEEWGDPINNQDEKSRLFHFSPLQNLRKSSVFPHLFITHGLLDERVSFQQSVDYINRARMLVPESTRLILNLVENQAHESQTLMLDINEKAKELEFILECVQQEKQ